MEVEPAHQSDAKAIIPAFESANQSDLAPKQLLADSLYDSDDNHQDAEQLGVEVVAPVMGSTQENTISLEDFGPIKARLSLVLKATILPKQRKRNAIALGLTFSIAEIALTRAFVR